MAGDWIKVETCLPDKPEVWQIAGMLGLDPDAVLGKLLRVWGWFDAHTQDGNAHGVTFSLVDRVACVTGFAEAMMLAGWLEQDGSVMSLPNFSRHNGKTAKNRALTNDRVASSRKMKRTSNEECNADTVTKTVTREEKRREEVKSLLAAAHGNESGEGAEVQAKATKASRLSADWEIPADWIEWAMKEFPGWTAQHVSRMADRFKDYWIAKPGKDATKTNWHATWRNWVRNEADRNPPKTPLAANQSDIFKACI